METAENVENQSPGRKKQFLGRGTFGEAWLITEENGDCFVEKIINLSNQGEEQSNQQRKVTEHEARVLKKLKHPNIIEFRDVKYHKKGPNKTELVISMEYAEEGSLQSKIDERVKRSRELQ